MTLARLGQLSAHQISSKSAKSQTYTDAETLFDAELETAVKGFQQSRGIMVTGTIDEATLRRLREASYSLGARVLSYQPSNELVGEDVAQLQAQLQELGFYTYRVDGHFGPRTYKALKNYQMNYGLNDDGICGPETIRSLKLLGRRITGGSPHFLRERERVRQSGPKLAGKRVVIDPALGGTNKGMSVAGLFGPISEEEIIWDLATRIEGRMIATGVETIMSRPRQADPSPKERAEIANAFGADLMISLHLDRYPNEKASGVATFYFGSEQGSSSMTGELLSGFVQREIAARTELVNCGNHGRTWDLLRMTRMPAIEIIAGYLSNPGDVAILTDPKQRDAIAEAIIVAVKRLYLLDDDTAPTGSYNLSELLKLEQS